MRLILGLLDAGYWWWNEKIHGSVRMNNGQMVKIGTTNAGMVTRCFILATVRYGHMKVLSILDTVINGYELR